MVANPKSARHPLFPLPTKKKLSIWQRWLEPQSATEQCYAKLNLFLHVTGRRADGYHLLQSWVAFCGLNDLITVRESKTPYFLTSGPFARQLPQTEDNLVTKTLRLMSERYKKKNSFYVELVKNIPIGAGLGGGSANVAGTLRALQKMWGFEWQTKDADWLAKELGADVPVCLYGQPAMVGGIGEKIRPAPFLPKMCHAVIVYPSQSVYTREVFDIMGDIKSPPAAAPKPCADVVDLVQYLNHTHNDLMHPAMSLEKSIVRVYREILHQSGCLLARMTGSGSSCFGIFADAETAKHAAKMLSEAEPTWWVRQTYLLAGPPPVG